MRATRSGCTRDSSTSRGDRRIGTLRRSFDHRHGNNEDLLIRDPASIADSDSDWIAKDTGLVGDEPRDNILAATR
jgi:hypothetical protein